jgi:hypothetical protein
LKIALLLPLPDLAVFLKPFIDFLVDRYELRVFSVSSSYPESDPIFKNCNWTHFKIQPILDFSPDRVICWNIVRPEVYSVIVFLAEQLRQEVLCLENGWLPQKDHLYLLPGSSFARSTSSWVRRYVAAHNDYSKLKETKNKHYPDTERPKGLPSEYILIPGQLAVDVALNYGVSGDFRDFSSFVHYVNASSRIPVIYSRHPKGCSIDLGEYCGIIPNVFGVSTLRLAEHATKVMTFNSTVGIEALFYHGRVEFYGRNLITVSGHKDISRYALQLDRLLKMQFNINEGPTLEHLRILGLLPGDPSSEKWSSRTLVPQPCKICNGPNNSFGSYFCVHVNQSLAEGKTDQTEVSSACREDTFLVSTDVDSKPSPL